MKLIFFRGFIFIFFIIFQFSYSQKLQLGVSGGYSRINYVDYFTNNISNNGLGLENGLQIGFNTKYQLSSIKLRITGNINYSSYKNEGKFLGAQYPYNSHFTEMNLKTSSTIMSYGLGLEHIINLVQLPQYLSLEILANSFSGTKIEIDPSSQFSENSYNSIIIKGTRFGLGFGLGVEFSVLSNIAIGLNIKYKLMNLIGKENKEYFGNLYKEKPFNIFNISFGIIFEKVL